MQIYIILGVLVLMIMAMISGKYPLGLITITSCMVISLCGIIPVEEAFSGFMDKNLIICAGFLVIGSAFGKTSIVTYIQSLLNKLQDKKGGKILYISLLLLGILMANMLTTSGVILIMVVFLSTMSQDDKLSPSQIFFPISAMCCIGVGKLPFGMTVASQSWINGFLESAGSNQIVSLWDVVKVGILPVIISIVYALFAYKMIPKHEIGVEMDSPKQNKMNVPKLSKKDEIIIYIVFISCIVAMFLGNAIGDIMYMIPAVGVVVLAFSKAMDIKEIKMILSSDMIFMLAGIFTMASVMGNSGVGNMVGNSILKFLGGSPNGFLVLIVFAVVAVMVTNVMSNIASMMILTPISIATAMAGGMDPRGVAIVTMMCCSCSIILPTGSPAIALAFACGKYNIKHTLKYSIPLAMIVIITTCVSANIFFPVFR